MTLEELYQYRVSTPWQINQLMPVLRRYGEECDVITEFGVYHGCSTIAFLAAGPKELHSYDIRISPELSEICAVAETTDTKFNFYYGSSLDAVFESTDLLFLDSLHTYSQVQQELALHAHKTTKYLILHDVISWAYVDEDVDPETVTDGDMFLRLGEHKRGVSMALMEYLVDHPEWRIHDFYYHQSGLAIYKRVE